ncbi:MAG: hypothetical protein M0004_04895 [Actinomycetota bacterium]|nr:hypothetical protein [Actinomycetota bacterium]
MPANRRPPARGPRRGRPLPPPRALPADRGRQPLPASLQARRLPPSTLRRRRASALFGIVALIVLIAAGANRFAHKNAPITVQTTARHTKTGPAALRVGLIDCTFVDTSRPTKNWATGVSTPGRRLLTEVRYPTTNGVAARETPRAHPAYRRGPFPLIVFAPGFKVYPVEYRALLDAWVRAGYVVAAPVFPDTNPAAVAAQGNIAESDLVNQPADVAFVTRRLEAAARGQSPNCAFVKGLMSTGPVVLAGQSDGGDTVAALAYEHANASLLSGLQVHGVAVLSGAEIDTAPGAYGASASSPPMLFTQSRNDACNTPEDAAQLYNAVNENDKWFLDLTAKTHIGPYNGRNAESFDVVVKATEAFFRAEIAGVSPGAFLRQAVAGKSAVATLSQGGSISLPYLRASQASCYTDVIPD